MKKMRIALASMLVAAGITATAGAANFTNCADRLKDVGLFQGTNQGYQLDKAPTRAEASAMLVRLLGKEAEAEKLTYTAPFTDLKGWEKPYVQYLYDNGLANGMSATAYNPERQVLCTDVYHIPAARTRLLGCQGRFYLCQSTGFR
ncbi:S-layer homology domain-containing protein [Agathobaculum butyriciproducens]|uniref:S-layer homology domain-containing protein n=1 Tax=Agathobaculum butyriciproducens TaxID=1628085 RepID=UPI00210ECA2C|nr:S-layer homology domain-containing protein [Agathobaculum butyriciproducens]